MASIVLSSNDAIIDMTLKGKVVSWNLGVRRIYGHAEDEMLGGHSSLLTRPEHPDAVQGLLEKFRQREHTLACSWSGFSAHQEPALLLRRT